MISSFDRRNMNPRNILHDPTVFKDPVKFRPERFLESASEEAVERMEIYNRIPFGFGRRYVYLSYKNYSSKFEHFFRLCPGKEFAEDALWLLFAQFLAVYKVSPNPNFPPVKADFTSGMLS